MPLSKSATTTSPSEQKWRDDGLNRHGFEPSFGTIVTDARDVITRKNGWKLTIRHVRDWHPSHGERKGFSPLVNFHDASGRTGEVHHGTDSGAYQAAVDEGMEILRNEKARLEHEVEDTIRRSNDLLRDEAIRVVKLVEQARVCGGLTAEGDTGREALKAVEKLAGILERSGSPKA